MNLPDNIIKQFCICEPINKVRCDGISVIITIHGSDRIEQLKRCLYWISNQSLTPVEIIVVEHSINPVVTTNMLLEYPGARYILLKNDTLFCKAACYNLGVSEAKYDRICGIDCDLIMPTDFLLNGYNELLTHDACFLAGDIYFLTNQMKNMYDFHFSGKTWLKDRAPWQFHGGTFFINKGKYFAIGGHDENFKGYGSEDSEFYERVSKILKVKKSDHIVLHQEHGREPHVLDNIEKNKTYLYGLKDIPDKTRVSQLHSYNRYLINKTGKIEVLEISDIPITQTPTCSASNIAEVFLDKTLAVANRLRRRNMGF